MPTLYLECLSGISGDMLVAALLDLGGSEEKLRQELATLGISGYDLHIGRVTKSGIGACTFDVRVDPARLEPGFRYEPGHLQLEEPPLDPFLPPEDHNVVQANGVLQSVDPSPGERSHKPSPQDGQIPNPAHLALTQCRLEDILGLIAISSLSHRAKQWSADSFRVLANAEAAVLGVSLEDAYFHQVGVVDAIVDIVGTAILLDDLGVDRVVVSPPREGQGTVWSRHGPLPVPAPATLEIARTHGVPLAITHNDGEMVTPAGMAIVAAIANAFELPEQFTVERVGCGAGKGVGKNPGLLRAMFIREKAGTDDRVLLLECNLDDMTGEALGYACGLLMEAGALDVWLTPISMKKGRPGQMLSLLIPPEQEARFVGLLFAHTTTIGVRKSLRERSVMARRAVILDTPYGPVAAKESRWGKICKTKPEFEALKTIADAKNLSVNEILLGAYPKEDR